MHHHDLHARSLRLGRRLIDTITMDVLNWQAVDAHTATMIEALVVLVHFRSDPCYCTVTSPARQTFFLFLVVESRPRRYSINASDSLLCVFQLWYGSLFCLPAFSPRSSHLYAWFRSLLFIWIKRPSSLVSRLFMHQAVSWTGYIPFVSSLLLQLFQGCCWHWGSRPPPRNDRGCSLFLITNTFALHHVIVRYGSLPLHVFHSLYLGALSSFGFLCPQPEEISDIAHLAFYLSGVDVWYE